jgi:hypothetical protein
MNMKSARLDVLGSVLKKSKRVHSAGHTWAPTDRPGKYTKSIDGGNNG